MPQMKSLESKSTKKPFILRINKVEVKKKILSPKVIKRDENEELKNKEQQQKQKKGQKEKGDKKEKKGKKDKEKDNKDKPKKKYILPN